MLSLRGITKRFGGLTAVDGVDMDLSVGEVLAIVGDNGAGKSTLIKMLTGLYTPTEGEIRIDGKPVVMSGHRDAMTLGIDAVYQTLGLVDGLDAASNIFLGNELKKRVLGIPLLDNRRMKEEAARVLLEELGVRLPDMDEPIANRSGGQRQAVAIARAVNHDGLRVLVMDEPTAALGPQETRRTLDLIKRIKSRGIAVVVISHSLDHVFEVADRVMVMRRGRCVGTVSIAESTHQQVLGMIVGAAPAHATLSGATA